MSVGKICTHQVVTVDSAIDAANAASVMRERHVGYLVVTDKDSGGGVPVGVLTDRDIVVRVVAMEIDPHVVSVGDVMTRRPLVAGEDDEIADTLRHMRQRGVRRVPVLGARGNLAGVLSLDDVVDHLRGELADITGSIDREQDAEQRSAR